MSRTLMHMLPYQLQMWHGVRPCKRLLLCQRGTIQWDARDQWHHKQP